MKNLPATQQNAVALKAQKILNRRPVYMIVMSDIKDDLIHLAVDLDPEEQPIGFYSFSKITGIDSHALRVDNFASWSSKAQSEKMMAFARKHLVEMSKDNSLPAFLNEQCIETLTILKLGVSAAAEPKRVRKSPGGGQDHSTLANPYGRPWPFSAAGPERAELEARLKKTKNPEMRSKLQRQLAAFATDEESK